MLLHRYVDMIANPEVADVFRKRAKVWLNFFKCNGQIKCVQNQKHKGLNTYTI